MLRVQNATDAAQDALRILRGTPHLLQRQLPPVWQGNPGRQGRRLSVRRMQAGKQAKTNDTGRGDQEDRRGRQEDVEPMTATDTHEIARRKTMTTEQRLAYEAERMAMEIVEGARMSGGQQLSRVLVHDLARRRFQALLEERGRLRRKLYNLRKQHRRLQKLWESNLRGFGWGGEYYPALLDANYSCVKLSRLALLLACVALVGAALAVVIS